MIKLILGVVNFLTPTPIARRRTVTARRDRREAILVSGGAGQGRDCWRSETAEIGAEVRGRKKRAESSKCPWSGWTSLCLVLA
jgi:hypothetical protein